jgi:geranylgeranyl diphosphate synthase, type I
MCTAGTMKSAERTITMRQAAFDRFQKSYAPRIDASIRSFFRKKRGAAHLEFMRDIYDDLQEYCLRDGKRIRPLVLLASFLGFSRGRTAPAGGVIKVGAALELMHAFLLVQDDIIDKSRTRRGGDALHVVCERRFGARSANPLVGSDVALVAGDVLFSNALQMISGAGIAGKNIGPLLEYFGNTYEYTAWGQIYDSLNSMPADLAASMDSALDIGTLKTAYYTAYYPMVMGYVLTGGREKKRLRLIRDAAIPMGLAFQLRDDILGVFGDTKKTGKSADSDIREGKMTALVTHTLRNTDDATGKEFSGLFLKREKSGSDISRIRAIMRSSGAPEAVRMMVMDNARKATRGLGPLGLKRSAEEIFDGFIARIEDVQAV